MNTHHLSATDRAGARRIVKAWKMDQNDTHGGRTGFQSPSRDPLDHARFFREVLIIASPGERRQMNRRAIDYLKYRNEVLDQ